MFFNYNVFSDIKSIAFGGIILDICSFLLFIIFYSFPFDILNPSIFNRIIFQITNYTQGIYSLHLILKIVLIHKFNSIKKGSFSGCFILYIFSYFLSFLGEKLHYF